MNKLVLFFLFTFAVYNTEAQYISSISVPDKTVPVVVDENDKAYRFSKSINASDLRAHLEFIASDSLQGRETGQPGIELAASYITNHLRNLGIQTFKGYRNYRQPVAFTYSKWIDTDIYIYGERYRHLWDYLAFPTKNNNAPLIQDKEVIFMGYGIEDAKYNDYKGKNVEGKIIMINRGEPMKKDSSSYITGSRELSDWSNDDMEKKLMLAKEKGAKMVLIIENDIKKMLEQNRRKILGVALELGDKKNDTLNYPNHCYISSTIAKKIIGQNEKKIIDARKKMAKGKPVTVVLPTDFIANLSKEITVLKGDNIIGYIEGWAKKDEYVIVSAHYDHLGMRGDDIFNGADDNGSGTVTLLELAQAVQQAVLEGFRPERNIVFMWFTGEEKGLLGSEYYSKNPVIPLEQTIANINVDMVGRVDELYKDNLEYTYVIGSDRLSSDLHKINEEVNQKYSQLTMDYTYNAEDDPNMYYFRSDHYNFAKNGVPSIFFFSGIHPDYHRPSDTVEKINFNKMEKVGRHIFHVLWELANRPDRIRVDGEIK
ncbi:MAG: M28 family peptidase [Saprospiraceae bacterium]|nr:M28 family peptidase [Saprospiraceae bacterium]